MGGSGPSPEQVERFRLSLEALAGSSAGAVGVAVSGGPDSLALLLLACAARPGAVKAATVDHGLRAESAAEAETVERLCKHLGIPHATLRPDAPVAGNLQSSARRARYALLEAWRRERGLDWLLTAHHADDQAETLLMRLNRGAGAAGLSGVRARNGRVLRPLLGWRRSELEAIVAAAGLDAASDPSNVDPRFDRARMRRDMAVASWLEPAALARSAEALADANEALDWEVDRLESERARAAGGAIRIEPAGLPRELRRRLLLRALRRLNPNAEPRGEELGRLLSALERGETVTLAGVKAVGGESWRLDPAPPRRSG